ncbi:hypothetical protein J7E96_09025 [Streptomyces sp. ISL-96]|uniref:hypothetical protein n=1 Tax=Streptomyces sp. ISL-96 TaxID=2819191 RepID=UPI001BECDC1D|nr:hypothetical protein [Streptomyces sp. ISL-96]MBT2488663.1 hypothetical protein [Streptomyces sp. ISL-96]
MLTLIKDLRDLGPVDKLYRIVASLAGCAAIAGLFSLHSGANLPLEVADFVSRSLGFRSSWASVTAHWLDERHQVFQPLALVAVCLGTATCARSDDGVEEGRGAATAVWVWHWPYR